MNYERFSVIGILDNQITSFTETLRRRFPPKIAVMPAHTTLRGSFVEPQTLKEVIACLSLKLTGIKLAPLRVTDIKSGRSNLTLVLEPNAELLDLHDRLFYALKDVITDVYGDRPSGEYHPHVTLLYEATKRELAAALKLVERQDISAVKLTTTALMGRLGGREYGKWKPISTYNMG